MKGVAIPKFRLTLLGCFELSGPDGPVDLPNKKVACLLAYLACTAPVPQSREKLATLLWGSYIETRARHNLRQTLFRLRRALGQDALIGEGEAISLTPGVIDCDAARLDALIREGSRASLAAAADLYQGRLIDDVAVSEEGWSEWLIGERERLLELALGAMVRLGEQELVAGRAAHALRAGHRAIALNNMREDAHRLVVQALAAAGRKAEALKHYQDLVALLKRELNTEPDAATNSLVAELGSAQPPSRSPAVWEIAKPALPQPDQPSIAVLPIPNLSRNPEEEVSAANPAAQGDAASSAVAVRSGSPERRQLTIMVCNMVGSMPLSPGLDPEDMRDRISSFHKMAADVVARFDGFVAQYLGDGVHVYFGYPAAHEHDAERAVRAGLAILDAVGTLKAASTVTLQASVGIATGLVVVGEQLGTGDTRKHVAIGEPPTLAARLQAEASPGEIVIAASTWRLVGWMFECHALGAIEVKGLPHPVEAWQVRGETAGVSRFEARRAGALSPLVGRREEIDLLLRRWDQAKLGKGRVVLLSGEPGIGKSRIAETPPFRLEGEPHARLRYFCSPHHTRSPLYPFIAQLERVASFEPGSSARAKLDKLEALLKPTATNVSRDVAIIAELLAVPADERYPALAVSPQQKREMILTTLLDQLDGVAAQSPVLIMFEDIHWIDPTSLDLLDRTIARIANLPVLLVITSRPEFQPAWVGQPHVTMLPLNRLGRRDSASIIGGITQDKALPDAVVEQILAHTDGVPLFIEEFTRTLLESGLLRETTESYVLDGPMPPLAVPTTLQASLVAHLDRLGSAKDVALIGAAIGRQFSHELIAVVSGLAPMDLYAALERLTTSGLISRRGTPPDASYLFKHALVQDAAYDIMLKSRRRQLHSSIAKVLVERFQALVENQPEVVAHHFTEAGLASEAVDYWVKAGRFAHARWANREAAKFFEQALHVLEALPETRDTLQQAIDLRFDLKTSLMPLGAFERIVGYLREAEEMARRLDDQRRLCQFSVHICQILGLSGNSMEACAFGQTARTLADSLGDVPLQVASYLFLGTACFSTLDYRQAEHLFLRVLQLLDGEPSLEGIALVGSPAVIASSYLTRLYADQGKFKQGMVHGQEGIRLAEASEHPYSLTVACWCFADLHIIKGDIRRAVGILERGLAVAREWNLTFLSAGCSGSLGYAYALLGRAAKGLPLLEQALSTFETMGHKFALSLFLVPLGETCLLAGRLADARKFAGRSLTLARESGQRSGEAGALHLLGGVAARGDPPEHAEGHYRDALALAEELEFRPLVARCRHGLGKLYLRTSKWDQARDHLTAASTMYRDMDMWFWLKQAEAEIRQLQ